jgi:predicted kinase
MKDLILLRGLPGSGKSTLAKILTNGKEDAHKEADMYFVDSVGNYKFDPSKLGDAHKWCREEIEFVMKYEHSPVVVSNTFTQEKELGPYFELAKKYGYRVHSIIVENRHGGVNEHDVPQDTLEKMKNRFKIRL